MLLRNFVKESWSQVGVELHRRHDLIPNLVEAVKGYAAHEKTVLESVSRARQNALAPGSAPEEQARREAGLSRVLKSLLAIAEAYPELKASSSFLSLQEELANTEDRIAATRRFYNSNVRDLNTRIEMFPSSLVATASNFTAAHAFFAPRVMQCLMQDWPTKHLRISGNFLVTWDEEIQNPEKIKRIVESLAGLVACVPRFLWME